MRSSTLDETELALAREAASLARAGSCAFRDVAGWARALGRSARELESLVVRHHHETAASFLERARVAAARDALRAGRRSSGVPADRFRARTGMGQAAWRRLGERATFELDLPPDFRAELTLASLGRDPESPCERREGDVFHKGLVLAGRPARLTLVLSPRRVHCTVAARGSVAPAAVREAWSAARRVLGLGRDPRPFERHVARDPRLRRLVAGRRGLRIPRTASAFEGLVWVIVGQQVNLAFAFTCRARLVRLCGRRAPGGLLAHPTARDVARLDFADLTKLEFSRRKAEYLIDAARDVVAGRLPLEELRTDSALSLERRLLTVRGLGPWSVHYLGMRTYGLADCVPLGDSALTSALQRFFDLDARPDPARTLELMQPFAPHKSLATLHLWQSLGAPV